MATAFYYNMICEHGVWGQEIRDQYKQSGEQLQVLKDTIALHDQGIHIPYVHMPAAVDLTYLNLEQEELVYGARFVRQVLEDYESGEEAYCSIHTKADEQLATYATFSDGLICSKCNGSRRVTCGSCRGGGYFLNQVYVDLKSDSFTVYDVFDHADTLPGEFTSLVGEPEPSDLDRRIIRVEDTEPINAIHSEKLFASGEFRTSYLLDELKTKQPEDGDLHYLNYSVEIRERDILDIFYTFGGKEYRLRADPIKDVIVFEHNPYEEFADSLIEELEDAYQTKHFKTLKKGMDDYETARADSVEPADERVEKLRKSLDRHVLLITLIAPFILLLISIVRYPMLLFQIRFYALGIICAGLCVVAVRKIWRYIVSDIRFLTEGIAIILSGLIFYGLNWLMWMFF